MTENLKGDKSKIQKLEAVYKEFTEAASLFMSNNGIYSPGFVWGCGNVSSEIVLIGEAPGREEVETGRPFAGKAGSILDEFIKLTGCQRDDMLITNTVKYRLARPRANKQPTLVPVYDNKELSNRPALGSEIKLAAPFLKKELEIIDPSFVVTLGNIPLKAVYASFFPDEKAPTVGACHGTLIKLPSFEKTYLYPVYHPASLIYNPSAAPDYAKDLEMLGKYIKEGV